MPLDWVRDGLDWNSYWSQLRGTGPLLEPVGDRMAHVRLEGVGDTESVQVWNPKTGEKHSLSERRESGTVRLEVPFEGGSIAVLVVGSGLPPAPKRRASTPTNTEIVPIDWCVTAESALDNSWGDLGPTRETSTIPIQVWDFEHSSSSSPTVKGVRASYGPRARIAGPSSVGEKAPTAWRNAEWSLSRGIDDDLLHERALGPKGYVPEEFIDWGTATAGDELHLETTLVIEPSEARKTLVIGAPTATRRIETDGALASEIETEAYYSETALPAGVTRIELRVRLVASESGPFRASLAVVTNADAYRRPEWLRPKQPVPFGETVSVQRDFSVDTDTQDFRIQVATEGDAELLVNGRQLGRHGGNAVYQGNRASTFQVHHYDLRDAATIGMN